MTNEELGAWLDATLHESGATLEDLIAAQIARDAVNRVADDVDSALTWTLAACGATLTLAVANAHDVQEALGSVARPNMLRAAVVFFLAGLAASGVARWLRALIARQNALVDLADTAGKSVFDQGLDFKKFMLAVLRRMPEPQRTKAVRNARADTSADLLRLARRHRIAAVIGLVALSASVVSLCAAFLV